MSHYAKVNNGVVEQVVVAEPEFFDSFVDSSPGQWLITSYNTYGGVHSKGGSPFRMNFAGVGFTYDSDRDAFIPPKDFPSWNFNEDTCRWDPPIPRPIDEGVDGKWYKWDEDVYQDNTNGWVLIPNVYLGIDYPDLRENK
jgi:hypothetical protein